MGLEEDRVDQLLEWGLAAVVLEKGARRWVRYRSMRPGANTLGDTLPWQNTVSWLATSGPIVVDRKID